MFLPTTHPFVRLYCCLTIDDHFFYNVSCYTDELITDSFVKFCLPIPKPSSSGTSKIFRHNVTTESRLRMFPYSIVIFIIAQWEQLAAEHRQSLTFPIYVAPPQILSRLHCSVDSIAHRRMQGIGRSTRWLNISLKCKEMHFVAKDLVWLRWNLQGDRSLWSSIRAHKYL